MTNFLATASVDAWDAWFRWREGGDLRDRTIDATWQRVADALAAAEADSRGLHAQRFADAFAQWQMLPDERLLECAGTRRAFNLRPAPVAVLNASAFLSARDAAHGFDRARVAAAAALAVRALDDALLITGQTAPASDGLRIGVMGIADAIARIGLDYDSDEARRFAAGFALSVQEGCVAGAIELAAERGAAAVAPEWLSARLQTAGVDSGLIADALRWGVRHAHCTAIAPQPRLALLANNGSDALDPVATAAALRAPRSGDVALLPDPIAQIRLRAAIQPHVDLPIDYPLLTRQPPGAELRSRCVDLAVRAGLPPPRWPLFDPPLAGSD